MSGMRRRASHILLAFLGAAATPAIACKIYTPGVDISVVHQDVPLSITSDVFVAEVQFEQPDAGWLELFKGARANILRVIQGNYRNDLLIVRDALGPDEIRVTCYNPIPTSGRGIILGIPLGIENGLLVLKPIFTSAPRSR